MTTLVATTPAELEQAHGTMPQRPAACFFIGWELDPEGWL